MKTRFFSHVLILCISLLMFCTSAGAQTNEIGTYKNGSGHVTNTELATRVILSGLPASAGVTELRILYEPESGKYYLAGQILNANITGRAIELSYDGGRLATVGGPALEITCTGMNCARCVPVIKKLRVNCVCEDTSPASDARCDMTSKVVLSIW